MGREGPPRFSALLLPGRDGGPVLWAPSAGGFIPMNKRCQQKALTMDPGHAFFESSNGVACVLYPDDGDRLLDLEQAEDGLRVFSRMCVPTAPQMAIVGWDTPSIFTGWMGRVEISQELLETIWARPDFAVNQVWEGWLTW
ncbi:unnamed protein product, partial [Mesorhabditis spiculigera]